LGGSPVSGRRGASYDLKKRWIAQAVPLGGERTDCFGGGGEDEKTNGNAIGSAKNPLNFELEREKR